MNKGKKTFLVTGGNGYIGSHMCKLLHDEGHEVITIDNHIASPTQPVHDFAKFYRADISESIKIGKLIQEHRPIAVFHFAALALVEESEKLPFKYFRENSIKSIEFIQTCINHGIQNIIFSSTCATYGIPEAVPITESTPQNPVNSYGMSKLMVEKFLSDMGRHKIINSVALRYFNVAGSDPQMIIGENHDPETHLIPNICKAYLKNNVIPFKLFGTDHSTRDGTCIRDYVHVCDLVAGHLKAFEYLNLHPGHHVFNLGSGIGHSVLEVMKAFEDVTGIKIEYEKHPARPGDPPELWADISKAVQHLGYKNEHSLRNCIEHTLKYLEQNWLRRSLVEVI